MRTQMATEAGTSTKPSDDRVLLGPNLLVVLDGVTEKAGSGCMHGVPWFADQLSAAIMRFVHLEPGPALKEALRHTAELHAGTCDLGHPGTPGAAVALVQIQDDRLRYLVLGDATVVVDTKQDLLVVSGTGAAAANPDAVDDALVGELALQDVRRLAILTDGAARAVDMFGLFDWPKALDLMASSGPDDLIRRMRQVEKEDAKAVDWPRDKVFDDATVVFFERKLS
ncbi:hypothetical protein Lesp02_27620 [Lentzea sp. NBRC 105346]|uniref:protein phosphatase 2C domain-containing protein n=1 Tax=Lentzea sp. NBRC 105346 TaxID=3032205 RepID=UPI002552DEC8|nr:protein phosphatase 2C domain-containing protein [Lentzea sp. NBRC 105346]GLZ30573.1 hypothetical protein Lesp02_27620 [Lentzea sp. NBRC 105346]